MRRTPAIVLRYRDNSLTKKDILNIQSFISQERNFRTEIYTKICCAWDWRKENGTLRKDSCRQMLKSLEKKGIIKLPDSNSQSLKASCKHKLRQEEIEYFEGRNITDLFNQEVIIRPINSNEVRLWKGLCAKYHYLGFNRMAGESILYLAEQKGEWLALLAWGAAAFQLKARDKYIGWSAKLKWQRLNYLANNWRFLILPGVKVKNLASHILAKNIKRLSQDWLMRYNHPIYLLETFVDSTRFKGTCYQASNWKYLGETHGSSRKNEGYITHGNKKSIYIYPLQNKTQKILRGDIMVSRDYKVSLDIEKLPLKGEGGLIDEFQKIVDPRKARGIRHSLASVLAMCTCAILSGASAYESIADWISQLSREQLKLFGSKRRRGPSEPTVRRVMQNMEVNDFEKIIGVWVDRITQDDQVAIDGKTLRGSKSYLKKATHLLSAAKTDGSVISQVKVDEKSNEIPAIRDLFKNLDISGKIITADALHTQYATAEFLVKKKANYFFVVKDNQKQLKEHIEALDFDYSKPLETTTDKEHGRLEVRKIWVSDELNDYIDFPYTAQVGVIERIRTKLPENKIESERVCFITSLSKTTVDAARLFTNFKKALVY